MPKESRPGMRANALEGQNGINAAAFVRWSSDASLLAGEPDVTAVAFDDLTADPETEPAPCSLSGEALIEHAWNQL